MYVVSYSEARNHLKRLCDQIRRSRIPARIKRRGGDVVIVAAEDWEAIEETLHIQSIPGAVERIKGADDFKELDELSREALEDLISDQA
ncbi:MAG: type II toxin-antitoxin system Phd/YefM family antitoxin [Proteobacteria bacterium]|nr:type II toxin-antitoxin system Phd/YefM family antitoxin [Pseudomonadota bacterium]